MLTLECKDDIARQVRDKKFVIVRSKNYGLNGNFEDFMRFTRSWDVMPPDAHFGQSASGARYRRYSDFNYDPVNRQLGQCEHRAYVQSLKNNRYVGGVERHFSDFTADVLSSPVLRSLVDIDFDVYKATLDPALHSLTWQCQIHQIRIKINPGAELEITPEGIHCDGYPFSGVHFWGKENVEGAESQLFTSEGQQVAAATYEEILDTTYFLDREMQHYVTPARTLDAAQPAYRQIIAISFSIPGTEHDIIR